MPLETPLLDQHVSAHAEIGEYFGTRLPARFGDAAAEYRVLRDAVALVDTNFLAWFSFSGPDRQRYLNAVLTSNVRDLQPGQGTRGLLLTNQGHIFAEVETYALADRVLVSSPAMVRERTYATFDKFIIMDDVTLEDVTDAMGTLALLGPRAAQLISELSGVDIAAMLEFSHIETTLASISCRVVRRTWFEQPCAAIILAREKLVPLWRELESQVRERGGAPAGMDALNAIRLEYGVAWFGHDYDDKQIPHEAGLEQSHISYEKGCYTGQEIVERVRSRGHANRRLTDMQFLSDAPPVPGTKLFVAQATGPTEVGYVTSAAFSPLLGRPIGLGYVRREHATVGTRLDASGIAAEVIAPPSGSEKQKPCA